MHITLIGMSNVGKTYWSKKLEEEGFKRFSCDDYIEKKLEEELSKHGYSGINDVARWMGQPYASQYPKNSSKYLEFEKESLVEIINKLENNKLNGENIVIDTTASVIYTGKGIMDKLSSLSTIVYLDTPKTVREEMFKLYIGNPKPVIWGNAFKKRNGESDMEALALCYPRLLEYRTDIYRKYADITMNYYLLRNRGFDIDNFLYILKETRY